MALRKYRLMTSSTVEWFLSSCSHQWVKHTFALTASSTSLIRIKWKKSWYPLPWWMTSSSIQHIFRRAISPLLLDEETWRLKKSYYFLHHHYPAVMRNKASWAFELSKKSSICVFLENFLVFFLKFSGNSTCYLIYCNWKFQEKIFSNFPEKK